MVALFNVFVTKHVGYSKFYICISEKSPYFNGMSFKSTLTH